MKTNKNKYHHNNNNNNNKTIKKIKTLNCHPSLKTKNKKIFDYSCLTKEALETLKNTYNNKNPNHLITTNDPKEIWNQLHQKHPHCDDETCWLENIPDKSLQYKMKKELFTPFQPSNWKTNKNAWLSNVDMAAVLTQYEETYIDQENGNKTFISLGPTPIDFDEKNMNGQCILEEICRLSLSTEYNKGVRKIGIICNLDKHNGTGTHWVSMFIDMSEEKPFIFFFNSTSQRMPTQITKLVKRLQTQWIEFRGSKLIIYQRTNSECGMYSLFFIITCLTRKTDLMPNKQLTTSDLVNLFAGKHRIDDKYVWKFREIYYNPSPNPPNPSQSLL